MSQLLRRIDIELAVEHLPSKRGELLARRACYLARLGQFIESRELIEHTRNAFPTDSHPRVSIWVMLAEGVLYTFQDLSAQGRDRVMRAQVLATATRDRTLIAWTSAWHAHLLSECSDFAGMGRALEMAFRACSDDEHEAIARAGMVLANAYSTCGDRGRANHWYGAVRHHALEAGDQATIDALIYNKAAFAMAWLRTEACFFPVDELELKHIAGEISSARNYQDLIGIRAVNNFVDLWQSRLALLRGEFVNAISGLSTVREKGPFAAYNFDQAIIDLEIAYCHFKLGNTEQALELAASLHADLRRLHRDEQVVAAWLLSQLADIVPEAEAKVESLIGMNLDGAKSAYRSEQRELRAVLQRFDNLSPPGLSGALSRHPAQ